MAWEEEMVDLVGTLGPVVGFLLIIFGISLTMFGSRLTPILVGLAFFLPFAITTAVICEAFLNISQERSLWAGLAVGGLAGACGSTLTKHAHVVFGGVLGMTAVAILLAIAQQFVELNIIAAAISLDIGFIIGAKFTRGLKDAVQFVAGAGLGGFCLAAGITVRRAGLEGLGGFDARTGESAIILAACMLGGALFQQWVAVRNADDSEHDD